MDCILFVNVPHSFIDFVQVSDRGGNHGCACLAIVIHKEEYETLNDIQDFKCKKAINDWASSFNTCQRKIISKTMNGAVVTCKTFEFAIPCNACESDSITG